MSVILISQKSLQPSGIPTTGSPVQETKTVEEVFKEYLLHGDQVPEALRQEIQKGVDIGKLASRVFSTHIDDFKSYMTNTPGGRRALKERLGQCISLQEKCDHCAIRFFRSLELGDNEDRLLQKAKDLLNQQKELELIKSPKEDFDAFFYREIDRLNAEKPLDAPTIVVIETEFDRTHTFRLPSTKLYLIDLAKTHYISLQKPSSKDGKCVLSTALKETLKQAKTQDRIGIIDAIIFRAHGSPNCMEFGVARDSYYRGQDLQQVSELLAENKGKFAEKLTVVLDSCSTAELAKKMSSKLTNLVFIAPEKHERYIKIWYEGKTGFHAFCDVPLYRSSSDKKNMQDTSGSRNVDADLLWLKKNRKRFKHGQAETSILSIICIYSWDWEILKIRKWELKVLRNKSLCYGHETLAYYNLEELVGLAKINIAGALPLIYKLAKENYPNAFSALEKIAKEGCGPAKKEALGLIYCFASSHKKGLALLEKLAKEGIAEAKELFGELSL